MNRSWPFSIGIAFVLSASAPQGLLLAQTPSLQQLFKEGYELQNKQNYPKALQTWDQILQQYPNEVAAYVNRALTRYYLNDLRGAVDDLSVAISKKADYVDAYYNRATILNSLKEYGPALADYDKYLSLAPQEADKTQVRKIADGLRKRLAEQAPVASNPTPVASNPTPAPTQPASNTAPATPPTAAPTAPNPSQPPVSILPAATTPTELPEGVVSIGKISGYDATTEDLLLGLKLSVQRKLLTTSNPTYKQGQNFIVNMKRGSTVDQSLRKSGLAKQSMIRLAWRGAAWRTYKVFIQ